MPSKSVKFCAYTGCKEIVTGYYCEKHKPEPQPWQQKQGKRKASPYRQWYSDPRWLRKRARQLAKEPLCGDCAEAGIITAANRVDHIIPHRGNWEMFIDDENLQSLCESCHNRKTAKYDGGFGNAVK